VKKPLLIYGTGLIAEVAKYYFENDSPYSVAAFTNHQEFISDDTFCQLPVLDFDSPDLAQKFPNRNLFIAIGHQGQNDIRKERFKESVSKGFNLVSYISSRAHVFSHFIGQNAFILENNVIQPFTQIGNNCTLWSGNHIGHHSIIGDHSFITSHVVVSGNCKIESNCFIGVNATIFDGVTIGQNSIVGAGSIVRKNIAENSIIRAPLSELKKE
jgi:sugar O-acyltransferase (sialic acid O-acetyltransferase NeuD family)